MTRDHAVEGAWSKEVDRMLAELRAGEPRALAYWAQQLAFSPVFFHALMLEVRSGKVSDDERGRLREAVTLALAGLGALPEALGSDLPALHLLARRQAAALSWDRRKQLRRLSVKLGLSPDEHNPGFVPSSMCRPYPLLGWKPPASPTPPSASSKEAEAMVIRRPTCEGTP